MADWRRLVQAADVPPGHRRLADLDGERLIVVNLDGVYHAIEDRCPHDGGSLADGELRGCEIVCPRHGARFDVTTGAVTAPPACEAVGHLATRVRAGWVEVRDDRWD